MYENSEEGVGREERDRHGDNLVHRRRPLLPMRYVALNISRNRREDAEGMGTVQVAEEELRQSELWLQVFR